jgi:hypothetical protein
MHNPLIVTLRNGLRVGLGASPEDAAINVFACLVGLPLLIIIGVLLAVYFTFSYVLHFLRLATPRSLVRDFARHSLGGE